MDKKKGGAHTGLSLFQPKLRLKVTSSELNFFFSSNVCITAGQIGDWKNIMTAAQSERVDLMLQEKLGDLSLTFIWE